jgi:hypothetical protein
MRNCIIASVFLIAAAFALAQKGASVEELMQRAQAAPTGAQPAIYAELAERQLAAADKLYSSGDANAAGSAVEDVVSYSGKAAHAAAESGSHMKPTEIALRKMAERLRTIRRTLALEDQKPAEEAADRLEALRNDLLARMFEKNKKKGK